MKICAGASYEQPPRSRIALFLAVLEGRSKSPHQQAAKDRTSSASASRHLPEHESGPPAASFTAAEGCRTWCHLLNSLTAAKLAFGKGWASPEPSSRETFAVLPAATPCSTSAATGSAPQISAPETPRRRPSTSVPLPNQRRADSESRATAGSI